MIESNNLDDEVWKDIPGYEGIYQASTFGRIKALSKILKHWKGGDSLFKEAILRPRKAKGYVSVALYNNLIRKDIDIHRLIALTFIPNPENKPEVNHKDGIKTNNKVGNLEWNTSKENKDHAKEKGLNIGLKGEDNNLSKLTEKEVLDIRRLNPIKAESKKILQIKYNICKSTINDIISRRTWKHI